MDGVLDGRLEGCIDGCIEGRDVGNIVGEAVGIFVGFLVGVVGIQVGIKVGITVGKQVRNIDGACVGIAMLVQGQNRRLPVSPFELHCPAPPPFEAIRTVIFWIRRIGRFSL